MGIPFYLMVIFLARVLRFCAAFILLVFLLPFAIPYIKGVVPSRYTAPFLALEKTASAFVHGMLPTVFGGTDYTRWIVIVGAIVIWSFLGGLKRGCQGRVLKLKAKEEYEAFKVQMHLADNAKVLQPLREKIESPHALEKANREELLKLFADTKKKLDAMGRDLAFLAIDVVDSTGMKVGEEKATIERDFREYHRFVDSKFKENGVLKASWTPDGVMGCFPSVDTAVRAAQAVIQGLDSFNRQVKSMRRDFRVRCGINSGYVYFDESIPMEEMSDRTIDIAGHMQKQAQPNTICIAKPAIEPLRERTGFVPVSKVVDGYEVYLWGEPETPLK